ncbi:MAG: polyketide synthase, partial [Pseudomonadota bacterium]
QPPAEPNFVIDWPDVDAAYRLLDEGRNIGKVVVRVGKAHDDAASRPDAVPVARHAAVPNEPIAIVGFAGRFPGAASVEQFWDNVAAGVSSVREVPPERWDADIFYDTDRAKLDRTDCRHGGFVDGIEDFDAAFFGIAPKEARLSDPQQRLFLESCWEALEHAGHGADMKGSRCGVYVGACGGDYTARLAAAGVPRAPQSFWGNDDAVLAARIAYLLDLTGPAVAIDTACSSSLVAIHLAAAALRAGECDSALAGGVFLRTTEGFHILCSNAGMLSPEGRCKAFGAGADGFVPGEGVGVLVLKRLEDALTDGDHVHALIEGAAINQDGRTNGITAPSARGQADVIRTALDRAGVPATAVSLIEAHGTGTRLGDPVEVRALSEVFSEAGAGLSSVALGSVK